MKQIRIMLSLTLLMSMVGAKVFAYSYKVDGICYNLNNNNHTATVTYSGWPYNNDYTGHYGGNGLHGLDVRIPSTITYNDVEYTVTAIGDQAFYDCESKIRMASITIPSTVTSIGKQSFWKCTALTSFTIPNNVTSISDYAFYGCGGLATIVSEIKEPFAFGSCAFDGIASTCTLIVPYGTKDKYIAKGWTEDVFKGGIKEAPIPNITFKDKKVKALCVANWDTNGDGELSEAEAAAVTDLGTVFSYNEQITSFDELQYFVNLTSIGNNAFEGCSVLTSVNIPNSVTNIGKYAFYRCSCLESVVFPNSVTSIGEGVCSNCSNLTSITISNNVKYIGGHAFSNTAWFENQPDGIVYIGNMVHGYKGTMPENTSITIKDGTISILDGAFYGCSNMTSVAIPNSIKSIGDYAFQHCDKLTSVVIPMSVLSIGSFVFSSCNSLTSIIVEDGNPVYDSRDNCNAIMETSSNVLIDGCNRTNIPDGTTSIGKGAFDGCNDLAYATVPSSVKSIDISAFSGCNNIKTMNIPDGVTFIGSQVFYLCKGLKSVTIPNSVNSIGSYAFYGCGNLTTIISEIKEPFVFRSSAFNSISPTCTLTVPYGTKDAYIAKGWTEDVFKGGIVETASPSSNITFADANVKAICVSNWDTNGDGELSEAEAAAVTALGEVFKWNTDIISFNELQYFTGLESLNNYAFNSCENLTCITIPSNVTSIGNYVFSFCRSLNNVTIPNSVTSLGNGAFSECNSFTSVTIPNSVTKIGENAFRNCKGLTSIIIPNSVNTLGNSPFFGCSGMKTIIVEEGNNNYDSRNNCNAIIKTTSNTLIQGCENTIIPSDVTYIGDEAFFGCSGLISIAIPNSVTTIGKEAFRGCDGLKSIILSNNLKSIGDWAFATCHGLMSITIPGSVTSIGEYAFSSCRGLTSIIIPNSVTSIGSNAFSSCSGLTSITIPNSVTSIGSHAFNGCIGLSSITIPNSLRSINDYVFSNCKGLTSVIIPNSVTKIGKGVFRYCGNLISVASEIENPYTFGSDAFDRISDNCTLIIPSDTKDAYIAAGWTEDVFKGGIFEVNDPALANYLAIEDSKVFKGGSVVLPVNMNNTESITALQFEAFLPDGVTISKCQLTNRKGDDHAASYRKLANGNYQVTVFSMSKAVFSGTEGAVANLTLDVDKGATAGAYPINITNIELTTAATQAINPADVTAILTINNVKPGDTNGDGKVSITDAVAIVGYILGENIDGFVVAAADANGDGNVNIFDVTKVINIILGEDYAESKMRGMIAMNEIGTMQAVANGKGTSLMVDNAERYIAMQFDVVVAAGQSVEDVTLNSTADHLLFYQQTEKNRYRVLACSMLNENFEPTEDALVDLKQAKGAKIENAMFVTTDGRCVNMTVAEEATGIETAEVEESSDAIYNLSGQYMGTDVNALPNGTYIRNQKKFVIK